MTLTRPAKLRLLHAALFGLVILVCTVTSSADTITLRGSVRLNAGDGPVTLREIADLSGDVAMQFADLVVADRRDEMQRLTIAEVRARLDAAQAPWGRLNLSGRSVVMRPARAGATSPTTPSSTTAVRPSALPADPPAATPDAPPTAEAWATEQTRRGAVVRALARTLNRHPRDFRVRFDAHLTHDLLAPIADHDLRVAIERRPDTDRIAVTMSESAGVFERQVVVEIPREQVVAARRIPKQAKIRSEDLDRRTIWTSDLDAAPLALNAVRDQIAARVIDEGDVIEPAMLEARRVIRRGDPVTVTRRVGMLDVTLNAKAMDDAAIGDVLEVQTHGRRLRVVCTSDGAAVVDAGPLTGGASK